MFGNAVRTISFKENAFDDEYVVALRIGKGEKKKFSRKWDYHFAVQLSDGTWADKPGKSDSRWNVISDTDDAWSLDGRPFYDSNIIYLAVKKRV